MDDEDVNESLRETNQFDEEFLRDILQRPQEGAPNLNNSSIMSSLCAQDIKPTTLFPTTYILSFDNSAALLPTETDRDFSSSKLPSSNSRANHGIKKPGSASESLNHIMSERNRRQELTSKFIALAATIPGLKKVSRRSFLLIFFINKYQFLVFVGVRIWTYNFCFLFLFPFATGSILSHFHFS